MSWQPGSGSSPQQLYGDSASNVLAQEAGRTFMARVYRWMFAGLALTGGVSAYVASNQQLMHAMLGLFYPLIIAELVMVFAFSFAVTRVGPTIAAGMFLLYALLNGLTFSVIFLVYPVGSIATAFFITAGSFAALSVYATVTKKDLSAWATFLFMGLIGIILAGIVNIFVQSSMMNFVLAAAGVVVFAGLTAYDTQKLRQLHAVAGYGSSGSLAIAGALTLYLDFINLFLSILRLLGRRR